MSTATTSIINEGLPHAENTQLTTAAEPVSSQKDTDSSADHKTVDIITPTYRIDVPIISGICDLKVPDNWTSSYIIVVDNPKKLCQMMEEADSDKAALKLEQLFKDNTSKKEGKRVGNNVRVICNMKNAGASATRNRALDTSTADFVLFLDDDVEPSAELLFAYDKGLQDMEENCVGLAGLVKFPRRKNMPLIHAAVLMSYLVYTFEIADKPQFSKANWGVTANLMVRRSKTRFDGVHFSIGGGEDVDYCLRMVGMDKMPTRIMHEDNKYFKTVPEAAISHDFWKGGIPNICHHVYYFGYGDSGLFNRYQECCFWSYLNIVEFFALIFLPFCPVILNNGWKSIFTVLAEIVALFAVDVAFEMFNMQAFKERMYYTTEGEPYPLWKAIGAHILANFYVICFQIGRLHGHWMRGRLLQNAGRRFDSQCGNLPDADKSFIELERNKLIAFVLTTFLVVRCI